MICYFISQPLLWLCFCFSKSLHIAKHSRVQAAGNLLQDNVIRSVRVTLLACFRLLMCLEILRDGLYGVSL